MKLLTIIAISLVIAPKSYAALCKPGKDAYGAATGSSKGPSVPSAAPSPAAVAGFPYKCGGQPCNIEVGVGDLLEKPNKVYEVVEVRETTKPDGSVKTTTLFAEVDKNQEKESAKAASERATKEAETAAKEAEKAEKEAAEAAEIAEAEAKAADDVADAERVAEADRLAKEAELEAERARAEAEAKEAEAAEAEAKVEAEEKDSGEEPPAEDDGGGVDEDDNIRPMIDGDDPWMKQKEAEEKAKRDYAAGKGKLDCSNPKVQCVHTEVDVKGTEISLSINVPVSKGGVDCRYSECMEGEASMERGVKLVNSVKDICTYSECLNSDDVNLVKDSDGCGPLGKFKAPVHVPGKIDRAVIESLKKKGGPRAVTVTKKKKKSWESEKESND